jgi:hypothetical protein
MDAFFQLGKNHGSQLEGGRHVGAKDISDFHVSSKKIK